MDPLEAREQLNAYILGLETRIEPVPCIRDSSVPSTGYEIPIRIYTPEGDGPFPVLIFIHGAGWVAGNLDTHDNVCRCFCARVGCVVVSVDYGLAPEHKFPKPVEESYQVYEWILKHPDQIAIDPERITIDLDRIAMGGDSSGGNIAAAVCLMARDRNSARIVFQLLVNPALDLAAYDESYGNMRWFREQYLRDGKDATDPYASPLLAENLAELPPAFIVVGEFDLLRTEGEAFGKQLREAGVNARVYCQAGKGHLAGDFARATEEASEAVDLCVAALGEVFGDS
jgi:acetyl esterase